MSRKTIADPAAPARKSRGPSARQLARIRAELWRVVCSSNWFDACLAAAVAGKVPLKRQLPLELDRAGLYPPGGSTDRPADPRTRTLMRQCLGCGGAWYPPQYVRRDGRCEGCHAAAELPPELANTDAQTHRPSTCSPSAIAIRAAEHYGVRFIEPRLAAEKSGPLRRQVARYLKTQAKSGRMTIRLGKKI